MSHKATAETKARVIHAMIIGMSKNAIAALIKVDPKTLLKQYHTELQQGYATREFELAQAWYTKAIQGDTRLLLQYKQNQYMTAEEDIKEPHTIKSITMRVIHTKQDVKKLELEGTGEVSSDVPSIENGLLRVPQLTQGEGEAISDTDIGEE